MTPEVNRYGRTLIRQAIRQELHANAAQMAAAAQFQNAAIPRAMIQSPQVAAVQPPVSSELQAVGSA
jgi:hypothetical protein